MSTWLRIYCAYLQTLNSSLLNYQICILTHIFVLFNNNNVILHYGLCFGIHYLPQSITLKSFNTIKPAMKHVGDVMETNPYKSFWSLEVYLASWSPVPDLCLNSPLLFHLSSAKLIHLLAHSKSEIFRIMTEMQSMTQRK